MICPKFSVTEYTDTFLLNLSSHALKYLMSLHKSVIKMRVVKINTV